MPISATPNSGYSFNNWTGSGSDSYSGESQSSSVTMNGPITETASFTPNNPPNTPNNVSPADGATAQILTLTLQSSAFSEPDGDTHATSQWQVLDNAGTTTVWNSGEDTVNKTSPSRSVPLGQLAYSTTYRWQVRYQDSRGAWSGYSTTTTFTTIEQLGNYYAFEPETFTWLEAKGDAERRGGHLATISSEAEWNAMSEARSQVPSLAEAWMGATDEETINVWKWITGEPFTYTRWDSGEPNNPGVESYLAMRGWNGTWNNSTGGARMGYFLEIESDSVGAFTSIRLEGGQIMLQWFGQGLPQQADDVTGPWSDVPNSTNPMTIDPTGPRKFYRLMKP